MVLEDIWPGLAPEDRIAAFMALPRGDAAEFFLDRAPRSQALLLRHCTATERRQLLRLLPPDDAADVLQEAAVESPEDASGWLDLLEDATRSEVKALLRYHEDEAGGRMNPRYLSLPAAIGVEEAIRYVRRATQSVETVYYAYVEDEEGRLVGVVSLRELLTAHADREIADIMHTDLVTVPEGMDQEEVAHVLMDHDLIAVPVVDLLGRMRGIVTFDDIADVVEQEATEDIQKIGGVEALDAPYLQTSVATMLRKRAGWLAVLFVAQMLTASALGLFEADIVDTIALVLFLPLIISSGGNSGGQASALVIRAMALGQVALRDAGRVFWREVRVGLLLGLLLAVLGALRIVLAQWSGGAYGVDTAALAVAVGVSLVAVVTWGALAGSMLPLLLRRLGTDPAAASAPLVATLVDVTGVIIYFVTARIVLQGGLA
jgi:magnesium transporter